MEFSSPNRVRSRGVAGFEIAFGRFVARVAEDPSKPMLETLFHCLATGRNAGRHLVRVLWTSRGLARRETTGIIACAFAGWLGVTAMGQVPKVARDLDAIPIDGSSNVLDTTWGVGPWIWAAETFDKQTCRLWRSFEIPHGATVTRAQLHIGVDNGYRLILDGREIGAGSDWRSITEYEIGLLLKPGRHTLAVEGFNDNREAGMLFGLRIEFADGKAMTIPSNTEWRIAPMDDTTWTKKQTAPASWPRAVVVSAFLPRNGLWQQRKPTMTVRVPVLRPEERSFWQNGWFQAGLWGTIIISVMLCLRLMAQLAVHSKARALLSIERARIARDIHDELGARLTELALEGEVAQTELPPGSAVKPRLEALCEKARAVSGAMDELVWMVNSRRDTLRDFSNYACRYAQRFLEPTPIRCRLDVDSELPEVVFELPTRRSLLLAVKEALNNAVKYSNATELLLQIQRRGQTLFVVVEDNGNGFELDLADPERNGLGNMAERMKEIGGKCLLATSPDAGCRVEFQVPLPRVSARSRDLSKMDNPPLAVSRNRSALTTSAICQKDYSK